jgi:hypothetical protein
VRRSRYARVIGGLGLLAVIGVLLTTILGSSDDAAGIAPGEMLAPFAVPLVLSSLPGDANVATRDHQGAAGNVPACSVRGTQILNICQLYEQGPVVLALFVDGGSCAAVLNDMQAIAPQFPRVRFAAVAIEGNRGQLRRLVRSRHLSLPVGIDKDGVLASLYKVFSCPQVNFVYPGGIVQSGALLGNPTRASLRARVSELVAASRAHGWRGSRT